MKKSSKPGKLENVKLTRRNLLTKVSAISGVVALTEWTTPVVKSVVLPAHAQTSTILIISNLEITNDTCRAAASRVDFFIEYDFESTFGVVSHVITTGTCPDPLTLIGGYPNPGGNLLDAIASTSVIITGDEFSGHMQVWANYLTGTAPFECEIFVTLTDANTDTVDGTLLLDECGTTPPP